MLAGAPLSYWIGFHALVLVLLAVDLVFLNHEDEKIAQRLAWGWTLFLFCLASGFALWTLRVDGHQHALEFFSSYLIETSLSVDNLFVFLHHVSLASPQPASAAPHSALGSWRAPSSCGRFSSPPASVC